MTDQIVNSTPQTRKTRVALMGEFSSGKSTLSNLLLGEAPLPMKVTATRLPPVLITHGETATYVVCHDGSEREIEQHEIEQICPDETRLIRLHRKADLLQICDLYDMPGISDPNLPIEMWQPLIKDIDCVVWCTHATQAWRQSEAAMWDKISRSSAGESILLVTQIDKLRNGLERLRVLNRLEAETAGKFKAIFPISLLQAIEAGEDFTIWQESGATAFVEYLVTHLLQMPRSHQQSQSGDSARREESSSELTFEHVAEVVEEEPSRDSALVTTPADCADTARVTPRRVRIRTRIKPRTPRPESKNLDREKILTLTLGEADSANATTPEANPGQVNAVG